MDSRQLSSLSDSLYRTLHLGEAAAKTDAELLGAFVDRRDDTAFEMLMRRHGPMVLSVCRRVLDCESDVEDAFQATFLVLAKKAASVRPRRQVGSFLYGVAHKTALKTRLSAARRSRYEREGGMTPKTPHHAEFSPELLAALDRELLLLPDVYRAPIVLCDLEGRTRKEAAQMLGLPEGTVASRHARGRKLLARRLATRDTVAPVALAATLGAARAHASVPLVLFAAVKEAIHPAAGAAISLNVSTLADAVIKGMLLMRLRALGGMMAVLACIGLACSVAVISRPRRDAGNPDNGVSSRSAQPRIPPVGDGDVRPGNAAAPADDLSIPVSWALLRNKAILAEIRCTEKQADSIRLLAEKTEANRQKEVKARLAAAIVPRVAANAKHVQFGIDLDQKELGRLAAELELDARALSVAGLRPEQVRRLRQLQLQASGPASLGNPEVARALGLTEGQRERITAATTQQLNELAGCLADCDQLPQPKDLRPLADIHDRIAAKCIAVLTPAQRQRWRELVGTPFPLADLKSPGGITALETLQTAVIIPLYPVTLPIRE